MDVARSRHEVRRQDRGTGGRQPLSAEALVLKNAVAWARCLTGMCSPARLGGLDKKSIID
jgi:hypothetical protein